MTLTPDELKQLVEAKEIIARVFSNTKTASKQTEDNLYEIYKDIRKVIKDQE